MERQKQMHADSQVVPSTIIDDSETSPTFDCGADRRASASRAPVSFATEELLLVDSSDRVTGYASKLDAHTGAGHLHRAFSVFLFDPAGRVLVHQRSRQKPLWPGYWTNSCCSHPRRGESLDEAVSRRITEELGVQAQARKIYHFEYHARFGAVGSEHELCHVFLARAPDPATVSVHAEEISAWDWMTAKEVDALVESDSSVLEDAAAGTVPETLPESATARPVTPWFVMEWRALRSNHAEELAHFTHA